MADLDKWRGDLQNQDAETRAAAAEHLCQAGEGVAEAAVDLVKACGDEESVQVWAVAALEEMGPPPVSTIPQLIELANDHQSIVAYWAITLLGRAEDASSQSEGVLTELLLTAGDISVRERAAWALGRLGPESQAAIDALKTVADSDSVRLARLAEEALS
ncbi:MAG: HEAT repeat domain-containing protein [Pirellulaceae bacterium]|nr:HEAT repeat domain-containing protein [Pirellulaceae bacterium]